MMRHDACLLSSLILQSLQTFNSHPLVRIRNTQGAKTPARLPAAVADTLLAHHITFRTLQPGLLEGSL